MTTPEITEAFRLADSDDPVKKRELIAGVLLRDTVAASAVLSWDDEDDIILMLLAGGT